MENVVLIIHLIIAVLLIVVVLLQRSEGGALGMGGGGGGVVTGRGAATALSKVTWGLAIAFICTSLLLGVLAASEQSATSLIDQIDDAPLPATTAPDLVPPSASDVVPAAPTDTGTPTTPGIDPNLPLIPPSAD